MRRWVISALVMVLLAVAAPRDLQSSVSHGSSVIGFDVARAMLPAEPAAAPVTVLRPTWTLSSLDLRLVGDLHRELRAALLERGTEARARSCHRVPTFARRIPRMGVGDDDPPRLIS